MRTLMKCSLAMVAMVLWAVPVSAAVITINGSGSSTGINSGFGDVIGATSSIDIVTTLGGDLDITFNRGTGELFNSAVMYIDVDGGATGFADTGSFTDAADGLRRAISGFDGGSNRSTLTFAPGFQANYAIAWEAGFAGLWLLNPSDHTFQTGVGLNFDGATNKASWDMSLLLADLGLSPGDSFRYVVTYLNNDNAFRSDEFHGVAALAGGNVGQAPVSLASGDFVLVNSIPEPASIALLGLGGLLMLRRRRA